VGIGEWNKVNESIVVRVKFFASLRQAAGAREIEQVVVPGTTVADLKGLLATENPSLPSAASAIYAAVNRAYAGDELVLQDGDEVALFPPVSGGQEPAPLFEVTESPLSLDEVAQRVRGATRGAIAVFAGMVRGETDMAKASFGAVSQGRRPVPGQVLETDYLEYEAYVEMAQSMLAQIGEEVQTRWPQVEAVAIVHRIGRLQVGEPSVVVAVASAHRQGTFEACSYAIERLKAIVPIWKKEVGSDGQWWVEGPGEASSDTADPTAGEIPLPF
jgi:molybdopterin synthase catalytic subunit